MLPESGKDRHTRKDAEGLEEIEGETFKHLAKVLPHIVWTASPDGVLDFISPRLSEFTGISPDDPEFLNWVEVIHPEDRDMVVKGWVEKLKVQQPYIVEQRLRKFDGSYEWFLARAEPVFGQHGQLLKWCGSTTNIDGQKKAQEAMIIAHEKKDAFIAMLGHELRNPLAAVSASFLALRSDGISASESKLAMDLLGRQIDHLNRLVNDTVDVARLSTGKLKIEKKALNLGELVEDWGQERRKVLEPEGFGLEVDCAQGEHWIEGDAVRLYQCLNNLVENAQKFSEKGSKIGVTLKSGDEEGIAILEVSDEGVGLNGEEMDDLFEPYTQGQHSSGDGDGGLGLGLSVVREVATLHGGWVSASNREPRGAIFTLNFPAINAPDSENEGEGEPGSTPSRQRILVVEDNASVARSLELFLQLEGHEVQVAPDGRQAIESFQEDPPDMVISDLTLSGGMSGWDVARAIKREANDAYLVALSGHAMAEHVRESLDAGFDEHLAKPPSLDDLRGAIERSCELRVGSKGC